MISGINSDSQSWRDLPWKKFQRHLYGLQKRVLKAKQAGDMKKLRSLQKLILRSEAARYLAVRTVTQLNKGKKTSGIDGISELDAKARFKLAERLAKEAMDWKHSGLRSVPIPKKDGSTRMLKVPTIADRAWQCLAKFVMEAAHEATFHERSYGFRPGRCSHDAQKFLFQNLHGRAKGLEKRVIEIDIEKCFDRINHTSIMKIVEAPSCLKMGIFRCLKAGVNPEFPNQGTPQGGVISPLLANIVLNGIEDIHQSVRYADDMIVILKPKDDQKEILGRIEDFLKLRGLNINQTKTKITPTKNGFDFLGWHFICQTNGKFRSFPSMENFRNFRKKVKDIINCSHLDIANRVSKAASVVRGWRQYHKYCNMSGKFNLWGMMRRACKVFNTKGRNKHQAAELMHRAFPEVPYSENRFINVKGNKTPFDGDIIYWSARNSKRYDNYTAKALKRQSNTCISCGLKFFGEEDIHLHHVDGNHSNWKSNNLVALHQSCHMNLHASMQKS
jgi:group II intron reverse transcriptase/maturase